MDIKYRHLKIEEAEKFWNMMSELDNETKFMMYEPGERKKNLEMVKANINASINGDNFLLAAENDGEIAGYIIALRGKPNRVKHSAYIVTGILKKYRGMGIGTELFKKLDQWARKNNLRRLELTVVADNLIAKHLYEKSGFVVEGIKKDSMYIDGILKDEYYMAKLLK